MKALIILMLALSITSCGKKGVIMEPSSMGIVESLTGKKESALVKAINEQTCIDDMVKNELSEKESIKKVLVDTDISYCNGLRVRLKILKVDHDRKLRAYGFAESSSGKSSCLKDGSDFNKVFGLERFEGTLNGDGIKISLGGHEYKNGKLIKNDGFTSRHVKFDIATFDGDMGFFEDNKLTCWNTH